VYKNGATFCPPCRSVGYTTAPHTENARSPWVYQWGRGTQQPRIYNLAAGHNWKSCPLFWQHDALPDKNTVSILNRAAAGCSSCVTLHRVPRQKSMSMSMSMSMSVLK